MRPQLPKVSVIMPVFNCAAYVEQAVQSVCVQTASDFELIVIDDGSTDDTAQIVQRLVEHDARIRLYQQQPSRKPAIARNAGLRRARAELITFLDGDDLWHPHKLSRELEVFERHPEVDLVFADLQKFSVRPGEDRGHGWLAGDAFRRRAQRFLVAERAGVYLCASDFYRFMSTEVTAVNMQTVMLRRSVLHREPYWFNEQIVVGEDADLFFRLAKRCRLAFIDTVLAYYRQREDSVTSDRQRRLQSEVRVYGDNLERARSMLSRPELIRCRRQVALRYYDLGQVYYAEGKMPAARYAYVRAFRLQPERGTMLAWIKTWAPLAVIAWARRWKHPHTRHAAGETS